MVELGSAVREHPDAVFVRRTDAASFADREGFRRAGYAMAAALLSASGGAEDRRFVIKPNVVCGSEPGARGKDGPAASDQGIVTDADFVGGIVARLRELGARRIAVAEGGGPTPMTGVYEERGYARMAAEHGIELLDLNKEPGTYAPHELNWTAVEGVVFREIPFVRPINDADTVFLNVPTMKTHNLGIISLCGKALQGTIAMGYRHFCSGLEDACRRFPDAATHYQPDVLERVRALYEAHCRDGYPCWSQEGDRYEGYAQRTCDAVQAHRGFLCIVEGVIGRDGTAFHQGKDVLANLTVGGVNPVHVDAITAYLMGHDPRNIGYLKVAQERGLGQCDPAAIPVFLLAEDGPVRCHRLEGIGRVPLGVYFRGDSSRYVFF
ncbi:MAG: DUF362 domain-containing protein [Candidatus Latescibacterota bacterium]